MGVEYGGKNERQSGPTIWACVLGAGGLAVGTYIGIQWEHDQHNVTTLNPGECVEHTFAPGDRADLVAQELGANASGEVSTAIHNTLDEQGYGSIEVCRSNGTWVITDLDNDG